MPQKDSIDFHPPRESRSGWLLVLIAIALVLAAGWWFWWLPAHPLAPVTEPAGQASEAAATEAPAAAGEVTQPAAPKPAEPSGPENPVDALASPDSALPPVAESDPLVSQSLGKLLGPKRGTDFLQLDHFVRRAVATVDNLGRPFAPDTMWPVHPTPGRFMVTGAADAQTIAPDNAARYDAFVTFATSVPLGPAVDLYARLYPLFQAAYVDLGYPGGYFNDRLVAVLDLLLATPTPTGPIAVKVAQVKGETASAKPWEHYEYVDPALESLSSGQKILIRMGPDNARRLKAVMTELRRRVATGQLAHPKAR